MKINWLKRYDDLIDENRHQFPCQSALARKLYIREKIQKEMMKECEVSKIEAQNMLNKLIWDNNETVLVKSNRF